MCKVRKINTIFFVVIFLQNLCELCEWIYMSYKLGINLDEMLEYLKYRIFAGRRLNEKSKTVKIETKKI